MVTNEIHTYKNIRARARRSKLNIRVRIALKYWKSNKIHFVPIIDNVLARKRAY